MRPARPASVLFLAWQVCLLAVTGCDEPPSERQPAEATSASPAKGNDEKEPSGGAPESTRVSIPMGELHAGTRPGRFERNPAWEPRPFTSKLGPFEIDAELYPNEPGKPPRLGVTREEASRLCGEAGGRLCTELEWERACRGDAQLAFATGEHWTASCQGDCTNEFGLRGMGSRPEWTASDFGDPSPLSGKPVLRGPSRARDVPAHERRCAHRSGTSDDPSVVGFRCCFGAPNAARVAEPTAGEVYTKRPMDGKAIAELLRKHPKTEKLAEDLSVFGEPEAINTVMDRGDGNTQGFLFTTSPLVWRPDTGVEFLVLAAKSGKETSFVLVYHVVTNDDLELASSFVMHGEKGPVILAYSPSIRPRLHFSSCWGCPGENGKILFRDPDSAVVLQP